MEGDFAPLEHLAVSGDIGCQNLEGAQGVIWASGGWRPRMLVNFHWIAPTPPPPQQGLFSPKCQYCHGGETLPCKICWWAFGSTRNVAAVDVELGEILIVV